MSHLDTARQTIVDFLDTNDVNSETQNGCLLRIHPMDLNTGLISFPSDTYLIGRADFCDLTINQDAISRRHCQIKRGSKGNFFLSDLGSTNGTRLNEKQLDDKPCALEAGDTIQVGSHFYKFLTTDHIEAHHYEATYSMMTSDSLTGICNKRYFLDMLNREIRRSSRSGLPLAVLMLDLDYFKKVNDEHGHIIGDEVLREFACRIQNTLREEDVFARYGGEEFIILLNETNAKQASAVAQRCLKAISESPFETSSSSSSCTVSIGAAIFNGQPNDTTPQQIIRVADSKMYEAKKAGRDQFVI